MPVMMMMVVVVVMMERTMEIEIEEKLEIVLQGKKVQDNK